MNYLQDKKAKRNKILKFASFFLIFIFIIYFQSGIFGKFSPIVHFIFRPVFFLGNGIGGKFSSLGAYFSFKESILNDNQNLKLELDKMMARALNYDSLLDENIKLKETLGRKNEKDNLILAGILSKPNRNFYDVLIIDTGEGKGIKAGDMVLALGNIPIGRVDTVYSNSAKVVLFSSGGERQEVIIPGKDIFIEMTGRGGGNFEISISREVELSEGVEVVLPGLNSYVVAVVQKIISDSRDPLQKALLVSPVNIQELKFVEVKANDF
ncbi:hypothetical protein HZA26_03750 [Candidatus Nomurabacteria bacterium]|nr:hypothetical protein [Candidatus Nomurabacteria bacterium]